jgi:L-fucose isomerase-like protein
MQAEIFKRFYWWEPECLQRIRDKFGVTIEKRSFEKLAADAKAIPDSEADAVWEAWQFKLNIGDISRRSLLSALKIFMVVKEELATDDRIKAVGINCLNESRYSDTTPCLAWNMLYEESEMVWGCEADVVSMLTKYILHKSLGVPIMMTNLYPFMMGKAALAHERIPYFPETDQPEHHILAAHCGYLGVVPQSFSTDWALRKKVLAIVDDNATAIDARLPEGDMTLAKLHPTMETISVAEGDLRSYVQYADSDCLNGAVLKIADGPSLLETIASHHYLLMTGHNLGDIKNLSKIFDLEVEVI